MSERPPTAAAAGPAPPHWEHLFPALTPDVQSALLRRVDERGSLTTADLPTLPPAASPRDRPDRFLAKLFSVESVALEPFDPATLADADRPPAESHAFASAVGCPDLFLIDAAPGQIRVALAADLAAEAARNGRVLVVTPTLTAADAVVARLVNDSPADAGLLVGRALAPGESPARLTAASAARTAAAHGDGAVAMARRKVAAATADAESRLAKLDAVPTLIDALRRAIEQLPDDSPAIRELDARHAAKLATLITAARSEADAHALAIKDADTLRSERDRLAANQPHGLLGVLKGLFGKPKLSDEYLKLQEKLDEAESRVRNLADEAERSESARSRAEVRHREERQQQLTIEGGRLRAEVQNIASRIAALAPVLPDLPTAETVARIADELADARRKIEAELRFARQWAATLTEHASELAVLLRSQVRVVVATPAALAADPLIAGTAFDRLILADADHLTEADFLIVARYARRWILVGDPSLGSHRRPSGFFCKLWERLHCRTWAAEAGRLVAFLADGPRHERLRCEPLADRPDIQLRFADGPGGVSLVEVAFPGKMAPAEAKAFLASELGEIRLAVHGPVRWHETDDRIIACWPAIEATVRGGDWVELADGVSEKVIGLLTGSVAFTRSAGWDLQKAGEWLARNTAHAHTSRTAVIPRPLPSPTPEPVAPRPLAGVAG